MAFLDEDQPYAPRRAPVPRRRGPERQQLVARRAIAIAVGILVLILLDRRDQGLPRTPASSAASRTTPPTSSPSSPQSDQLSTDLFKQLDNPGGSGQSLPDAIDTDRGTADALLKRAQEISAPGDVSGAHASLVQAFQLRSDGIAGLASALTSGGNARQTQRRPSWRSTT